MAGKGEGAGGIAVYAVDFDLISNRKDVSSQPRCAGANVKGDGFADVHVA